jgi:hypothetical protein
MPESSITIAVHSNRLIATCLGLFTLLLYIGTARGTLSFGDAASMLAVTRSIATQGSVAVPDAPGAVRGVDGQCYSKYALGQSVLAVPFYLVGSHLCGNCDSSHSVNPSANPVVYSVCLLGIFSGAATVVLFYAASVSLGFGQLGSALAALALGACTFAWFYARTS